MDAKQYIRLYGVDHARELAFDPLHLQMTHVTEDGRHWVNSNNPHSHASEDELKGMIELSALKHLVEFIDYVSIHGYETSKDILKNAPTWAECYSLEIGKSGIRDKTVNLAKLKEAVAVHEFIYRDPKTEDMGDDSNLDHHVSPLCEVRDV
ncbi:hypothetical protein ACIN5162_1811 [Acinetobacter baumannii OIFC0162]|uniref:hypothetical protein n=1 Tax=Acinetobacter baumannii TaxID=470 RepID=UPI00028C7339|nr:hypothetical protein [Acinetobacter baumannii]EKK06146.1 hypothetical protein ACIN5162_1811 [Acinetobacter baumannii OIFC0162]